MSLFKPTFTASKRNTACFLCLILSKYGQSLSNDRNFWNLKVKVNISIDEKGVMENFIDIFFAKV